MLVVVVDGYPRSNRALALAFATALLLLTAHALALLVVAWQGEGIADYVRLQRSSSVVYIGRHVVDALLGLAVGSIMLQFGRALDNRRTVAMLAKFATIVYVATAIAVPAVQLVVVPDVLSQCGTVCPPSVDRQLARLVSDWPGSMTGLAAAAGTAMVALVCVGYGWQLRRHQGWAAVGTSLLAAGVLELLAAWGTWAGMGWLAYASWAALPGWLVTLLSPAWRRSYISA